MRGAELESLRADGLVYGHQVAKAFGVDEGTVTQARKRKKIKVAKWEPYGDDERPLYDPARLAVRRDGQKGPVDVGSQLAAKIDVPANVEPDQHDLKEDRMSIRQLYECITGHDERRGDQHRTV